MKWMMRYGFYLLFRGGGEGEVGGHCASSSAPAVTMRHPEVLPARWEANLCESKVTLEAVSRDEAHASRTLSMFLYSG